MIIEKVIRFIKENNMLSKGEHVVLGVSGGADSMCLLLVLMEIAKIYRLKLTVVHIHHGIRGEEADRDEAFVENFCKERSVDFVKFHYNIPQMAKESGLSTEEAGRMVRYNAFEQVRQERNADKIAVAHNAGDDVETILLNMCRGTGISGMSGIKPVRGCIIRPVMCLTRKEIEKFLEKQKVSYINDSTNFENDYTRNKIRNVLVPYLNANINSKSDVHIGALGTMLGEIDDFMDAEGEKALADVIVSEDDARDELEVDAEKLEKLHPALKSVVVRKLLMKVADKLKDISINHIRSVISIAEGKTGNSANLPYNIEVIKYPESLIIRRNTKIANPRTKKSIGKSNFEPIPLTAIPGTYEFGGNRLKITYDCLQNVNFEEKTYTKWLNCDILKNGLSIRTRQTGDYIIVTSFGGRKLLKDFFIDSKIPREKRDDILLLADGSRILWIIGYRIGEDAKVTENTSKIVRVDIEKVHM